MLGGLHSLNSVLKMEQWSAGTWTIHLSHSVGPWQLMIEARLEEGCCRFFKCQTVIWFQEEGITPLRFGNINETFEIYIIFFLLIIALSCRRIKIIVWPVRLFYANIPILRTTNRIILTVNRIMSPEYLLIFTSCDFLFLPLTVKRIIQGAHLLYERLERVFIK